MTGLPGSIPTAALRGAPGITGAAAGSAFVADTDTVESGAFLLNEGAAAETAIDEFRSDEGNGLFTPGADKRQFPLVRMESRFADAIKAIRAHVLPLRKLAILKIFATEHAREKFAQYTGVTDPIEKVLSEITSSDEMCGPIHNVYANIGGFILGAGDDVIAGDQEMISYMQGSPNTDKNIVWLENFIEVVEDNMWLQRGLGRIAAQRGKHFMKEIHQLKLVINAYHKQTDRKD